MFSYWSQIYSSHLPRKVKRLPSKFCCIGIGISCTANFFANIDISSQIKTWLRVTDRGLQIYFIYELGSKALNDQWHLNIECSILLWLPRCYLGSCDVFFVTFLFSSRSLGSLRSICRSFTEPFWAASWTSPWPWALCTRRKGSPSKMLKKEEEKWSWSSKDNRNNCFPSPSLGIQKPWRLNWFNWLWRRSSYWKWNGKKG